VDLEAIRNEKTLDRREVVEERVGLKAEVEGKKMVL
jgi:hypothetical protein